MTKKDHEELIEYIDTRLTIFNEIHQKGVRPTNAQWDKCMKYSQTLGELIAIDAIEEGL